MRGLAGPLYLNRPQLLSNDWGPPQVPHFDHSGHASVFGKTHLPSAPAAKGRKKKPKQKTLFAELDEIEATQPGPGGKLAGPSPGSTVLDRVHQAMLLFASGRGEPANRLLVEDGAGTDARFWKLAQSLSALYPAGTDERRWGDGVLARKKGLGL